MGTILQDWRIFRSSTCDTGFFLTLFIVLLEMRFADYRTVIESTITMFGAKWPQLDGRFRSKSQKTCSCEVNSLDISIVPTENVLLYHDIALSDFLASYSDGPDPPSGNQGLQACVHDFWRRCVTRRSSKPRFSSSCIENTGRLRKESWDCYVHCCCWQSCGISDQILRCGSRSVERSSQKPFETRYTCE